MPAAKSSLDNLPNNPKINKNVTLAAIGIESFKGIYSPTWSAERTLQAICDACGVSYKFVKNNPLPHKKQFSESLYINKVHIADGIGKGTTIAQEQKARNTAHTSCTANSIKVLKFKGLSLIHQSEVPEEEVQNISKDILTLKGDDLRVIEEAVEELFEAFLKDPKITKLLISNDLDKYEREVVLVSSQKLSSSAKLLLLLLL